MRYLILLRGINVGGNNKVSMTDLKLFFEEFGFEKVFTYINSGNVIVETHNIININEIEKALYNKFGFYIKIVVISEEKLRESLKNAPEWWGQDKNSKHNAIFVIEPFTADIIMREVGEIKMAYEQVGYYNKVIFWSASIKTFSKTRWSKIVGTNAYKFITIRNYNTTKKLLEMVTENN